MLPAGSNASAVTISLLTEGFPALFFVPAGQDTQPVLYSQQERELENLVAFVEEHKTAVSPDRDEL